MVGGTSKGTFLGQDQICFASRKSENTFHVVEFRSQSPVDNSLLMHQGIPEIVATLANCLGLLFSSLYKANNNYRGPWGWKGEPGGWPGCQCGLCSRQERHEVLTMRSFRMRCSTPGKNASPHQTSKFTQSIYPCASLGFVKGKP